MLVKVTLGKAVLGEPPIETPVYVDADSVLSLMPHEGEGEWTVFKLKDGDKGLFKGTPGEVARQLRGCCCVADDHGPIELHTPSGPFALYARDIKSVRAIKDSTPGCKSWIMLHSGTAYNLTETYEEVVQKIGWKLA